MQLALLHQPAPKVNVSFETYFVASGGFAARRLLALRRRPAGGVSQPCTWNIHLKDLGMYVIWII